MSRVLIFIAWVIFFAGAITIALANRGGVGIELFGWRADIPAGAAIVLSLFLLTAFGLLVSTIKDLALAPKSARARREIARREKGIAAVTRGLEAIAAGDGAAARREAKAAEKSLPGSSAARLIAAQAAQLIGDDAAAGEALAGMLDAPETEFLALRGLYARAMRSGDPEAARRYAERAFDKRDHARWAFDAAFDLALERHDYGAARHLIARAAKAKSLDRAAADRGMAAIDTAAAYAAKAAGDAGGAAADAASALKHAPEFAPAAVLAARLAAASGDRRKAEKILSLAFQSAPERALVETLEEIFTGEAAEERAAAFERLAARNPSAREAMLLTAKALMARGDNLGAAEILKDMLRSAADRRTLAAMGEAQSLISGELVAREFLLRAASAPDFGGPRADAFSRLTGEGWRRLIHAYMADGRLAPPSLEAAPAGLSDAELAPLTNVASVQIEAPAPEASAALAPPETPGEAESRSELEAPAPIVDDADTDEALERGADAARRVS